MGICFSKKAVFSQLEMIMKKLLEKHDEKLCY